MLRNRKKNKKKKLCQMMQSKDLSLDKNKKWNSLKRIEGQNTNKKIFFFNLSITNENIWKI